MRWSSISPNGEALAQIYAQAARDPAFQADNEAVLRDFAALDAEAEREAIFSFINENKINGVVLISADRHRSDAWRIAREDGYAFYEFSSSKLTNVHTHRRAPGKRCSHDGGFTQIGQEGVVRDR